MTSQHAIDFQTKGTFHSYPQSVCFFPKLETEVISSCNTRTSQWQGLSHALLTSAIKLAIFLGPKKSCALIKLQWLHNQCIAHLTIVKNVWLSEWKPALFALASILRNPILKIQLNTSLALVLDSLTEYYNTSISFCTTNLIFTSLWRLFHEIY